MLTGGSSFFEAELAHPCVILIEIKNTPEVYRFIYMLQYDILISFITVILKSLQRSKDEHRIVYKSRSYLFLGWKKTKPN